MHYTSEQSYTGKEETKELIKEVVNEAFDAVCSTMGPNSDLALVIQTNKPVVTKDGARVAKALEFNELRKNCIGKLITSAAIKTDEVVGDGTTTTVFMVKALFDKFNGILDFNTTRFIDQLVEESKDILNGLIIPVKAGDENFIKAISTTSNYQSSIIDVVEEIYKKFSNPNVTLKYGKGLVKDQVEMETSILFEGNFQYPNIVPLSNRNKIDLSKTDVFVTTEDSNNISEASLQKLANYVLGTDKNIIIVARGYGELADQFVGVNQYVLNELKKLNKEPRFIFPYRIKAPGTLGVETVSDLAKLLGVPAYSKLDSIKDENTKFGSCDESVYFDITGIHVDPKKEPYKSRVEEALNELVPLYEGMNFSEKATLMGMFLSLRIGCLRGENVTVHVSGMTEGEISERYYLYEDAFKVAKSCLKFGVIPGIGWGYNQTAQILHEKYVNVKIPNEVPENPFDLLKSDIANKFCRALVSQYEYITKRKYSFEEEAKYLDIVRNTLDTKPEWVYDNGSAPMIALSGAWSVVKRLGKVSFILGKSNSSYMDK